MCSFKKILIGFFTFSLCVALWACGNNPVHTDPPIIHNNVNKFTLIFNDAEGNFLTSKVYEQNALVDFSVSINPTIDKQFVFLGWSESLHGDVIDPFIATKDCSYYPIFQTVTRKYQVSYQTFGGNNLDTALVEYNAPFPEIIPVKKGYDFTNWFTDENLTSPLADNAVCTGDITLYAGFTKQIYNVFLMDNGLRNMALSSYEFGCNITLPVLEKTGYIFLGWYSDGNFTKQLTEISKEDVGDKTFYAKWEKTKVNITFVTNSSEGNLIQQYDYNSEIKTLPKVAKQGFRFVGWFSDENCTCPVIFPFYANNNISIYALWSNKSLVSPLISGVTSDIFISPCSFFNNNFMTSPDFTSYDFSTNVNISDIKWGRGANWFFTYNVINNFSKYIENFADYSSVLNVENKAIQFFDANPDKTSYSFSQDNFVYDFSLDKQLKFSCYNDKVSISITTKNNVKIVQFMMNNICVRFSHEDNDYTYILEENQDVTLLTFNVGESINGFIKQFVTVMDTEKQNITTFSCENNRFAVSGNINGLVSEAYDKGNLVAISDDKNCFLGFNQINGFNYLALTPNWLINDNICDFNDNFSFVNLPCFYISNNQNLPFVKISVASINDFSSQFFMLNNFSASIAVSDDFLDYINLAFSDFSSLLDSFLASLSKNHCQIPF